MAEKKHKNKPEEAEKLKQLAIKENWIFQDIDESKFISNGAEQSVYIKGDSKVIKINDAIYYASWEDYYNPQLGIILEDLHDENVLTQKGVLYFIDTVFL